MLVRKDRPPVEYSKCNQTVTIYHAEGGIYSKQVIKQAFFDFKKVFNVEKTGQTESNSFLLVIPALVCGGVQPVYPGDKVLLGEGDDIADAKAWAQLIPSKVPNLAVVKYVDPKYWNAEVIHWEAGG